MSGTSDGPPAPPGLSSQTYQCPRGFVIPDDPNHPNVQWAFSGSNCAQSCARFNTFLLPIYGPEIMFDFVVCILFAYADPLILPINNMKKCTR
jgi:hypothetical protein